MKALQKIFPVFVLAAWGSFAAAAEDHPGYVDFSGLQSLIDTEPAVEVTLREPLLRLITESIPEDDAEAVNFVSRLLNVRLHVYEDIGGNVRQIAENMDEIASDLEAESWERVVRIRDDDDQVDIYLRFSETDDVVYGIAVMIVSEDGEMVLANIAGDISFDDIGALGRRFDIDELSDYQEREEEDRN